MDIRMNDLKKELKYLKNKVKEEINLANSKRQLEKKDCY